MNEKKPEYNFTIELFHSPGVELDPEGYLIYLGKSLRAFTWKAIEDRLVDLRREPERHLVRSYEVKDEIYVKLQYDLFRAMLNLIEKGVFSPKVVLRNYAPTFRYQGEKSN